ncbi:MAG: 5-(carboxyamino)imidazole ribonucleotide synthase, partial [Candidatus Kapaibacterium sp.]
RSGQGTPDNVIELLRHTSVYLHLYNKKQSRIGRKMGHLTVLSNTQQEALTLAKSAADAIKW